MISKKQSSDVVACHAACEWFREIAIRHLERHGSLGILRCLHNLLGIDISVEVFFHSLGGKVIIYLGSEYKGFSVDSEFGLNSFQIQTKSFEVWLSEVVADTFSLALTAFHKSGPFVAQLDRITVEAAAESAGKSVSSKRL